MGRRMRRAVHLPEHPRWAARRTAAGQWVVIGPDGLDVFRHHDPVIRIEAAFLAAQAPAMKWALQELVRRLRAMEWALDVRDRHRVHLAECAVSETIPPVREVHLLETRRQGELDLAA